MFFDFLATPKLFWWSHAVGSVQEDSGKMHMVTKTMKIQVDKMYFFCIHLYSFVFFVLRLNDDPFFKVPDCDSRDLGCRYMAVFFVEDVPCDVEKA